MKNLLRFLLKIQLQKSQYLQSQKGFTLVELLVALLLAFLVLTPLLGFMIDMMNTDRKEQAKSTSEQEIQAALAYIAQDMEQAVYIYDADGIYGQTSTSITGILGQLPGGTDTNPNKVPVLVFWKRYFLNQDQTVPISTSTSTTAGCLVKLPDNTTCNQQDYMLYSLVAYYLVKDNNTTWNSTTARIERWEIRDGIRDVNPTQTQSRSETVNGTTKTVKYLLLPSKGFMPFNLSLEGDLKKKLGNWTKHSDTYDLNVNKLTTLVDYIDQTSTGTPTLAACNTAAGEQQVPDYTKTAVPTSFRTGSFYACVNANNYIARVYIRGNALARIKTGAQYHSKQAAYFPTANVQIKGRGFLGIE